MTPGVTSEDRAAFRRSVSVATVTSTAVALPQFLVATLAIEFRDYMGLGPAELGAVIAIYFLSAAVLSVPLGRLTEEIGALRVMRACCLAIAVVLAIIGSAVTSLAGLLLVMVPAGAASGAAELATTQYLARDAPRRRQGLAFGVKQASVPLATLLAGLTVPSLAVTVGWRWALIAGAALALTIGVMLPRSRLTLRSYRATPRPRQKLESKAQRELLLLTLGSGLSLTASGAATGFLAVSVAASGATTTETGLLVMLGGGIAIIVRVGLGALVDTRNVPHLPTVAAMVCLGGLGMLLFALSSERPSVGLWVGGVVLAFGGGWGWNGVFTYAVVSGHMDRPAQAASITQIGNRTGGVLGPLIFGIAVAHQGYAWAWTLAALISVAGASVLFIVWRLRTAPGNASTSGSAPFG
jgi:MFS family permease